MNFKKFFLQSLAITFILTLTLVLWVPWVQSDIFNVTVNPEDPTEKDDITLSVNGWFPDSCWSYLYGEYDIQNNYIDISVYTKDVWSPGLVCLPIILPYSEEFSIGKLESGLYFVTTTELRDSLRDPLPRYHYTNFTVNPANDCEYDSEPDGDVDGSDMAHLIDAGTFDIDIFAEDFGRTDCP